MEDPSVNLPYHLSIIEYRNDKLLIRDGQKPRLSGKALEIPGDHHALRKLASVIDRLGEESAKAQQLKMTITQWHKFITTDSSQRQRIYILDAGDRTVDNPSGNQGSVGFLKIGWKHLVLLDGAQNMHRMEALCVLDFYVREERRRMGYGKKLFDCMLKNENRKPFDLPIDSPSHKFRQFAEKHYNLRETIPQLNKFTIFNGFPFRNDKQDNVVARRETCGDAYHMRRSRSVDVQLSSSLPTHSSSSWRIFGLDNTNTVN